MMVKFAISLLLGYHLWFLCCVAGQIRAEQRSEGFVAQLHKQVEDNEAGHVRGLDKKSQDNDHANENGVSEATNAETHRHDVGNDVTKRERQDEDDDDDLEKETSELLNINVQADGKIVDGNNKHQGTKESIFDKENLVPYLKMYNTTLFPNMKNNTLPHHSHEETQTLLSDIDNLKRNLRSSLQMSKSMINHRTRKNLSQSQHETADKTEGAPDNCTMSKLSSSLLLEATTPIKRQPCNRARAPVTEEDKNSEAKGKVLEAGTEKSAISPFHMKTNPKRKTSFEKQATFILNNQSISSTNRGIKRNTTDEVGEAVGKPTIDVLPENVHNRKEFYQNIFKAQKSLLDWQETQRTEKLRRHNYVKLKNRYSRFNRKGRLLKHNKLKKHWMKSHMARTIDKILRRQPRLKYKRRDYIAENPHHFAGDELNTMHG